VAQGSDDQEMPGERDHVFVRFNVSYNGQCVFESDACEQAQLGENEVIKGVELAIRDLRMRIGSHAQLTLEALCTIRGGAVGRAFEHGLSRIAADIAAAEDVSDWRELTLKVRARPNAELDLVSTEIVIRPVKLSERVTSLACKVVTQSGQTMLAFNTDVEDAVDQLALFPRNAEGEEK
jgi:hypothetical protein